MKMEKKKLSLFIYLSWTRDQSSFYHCPPELSWIARKKTVMALLNHEEEEKEVNIKWISAKRQ